MSPWWPLLAILSRYPNLKSSHCNSLEDRASVDSSTVARSSNELQRIDYITGYQDRKPHSTCAATLPNASWPIWLISIWDYYTHGSLSFIMWCIQRIVIRLVLCRVLVWFALISPIPSILSRCTGILTNIGKWVTNMDSLISLLGPHLLTRIHFDPNMGKWLHPL